MCNVLLAATCEHMKMCMYKYCMPYTVYHKCCLASRVAHCLTKKKEKENTLRAVATLCTLIRNKTKQKYFLSFSY